METHIVRLWTPQAPSEQASTTEARGIVRHVRSGRETSFGSWEELRTLLMSTTEPTMVKPAGESAGESAPEHVEG
ncbi:MAG: hypothetical protein ACRDGD_07095 [Candidatus Limnocylindria bacterium]